MGEPRSRRSARLELELAAEDRPARLLAELRAGADVSDERFDRLFPAELRQRSARHWTPAAVARRAVELLAPRPDWEILDIGSGAGKLCILGALLSPASFVGVEQELLLVGAAQSAARAAYATRARFVHGSAFDLDWTRFHGVYLFNPFGELLAAGAHERSGDEKA